MLKRDYLLPGVMLGIMLLSGCGFGVGTSEPSVVDIHEGAGTPMASHSAEQSAEQPAEQTEERETAIEVGQDQVHEGNLVLVNREHRVVSGSIPGDVVSLFGHQELSEGFALYDRSIRLPEALLLSFRSMVDAAADDGVDHFLISSGYRDEAEQQALYEEKGSDYALPAGFSEHNLGLSLDIGSTLEAMEKAPEGAWLKKNAWKHGFILRYPKNKTEVTGIQYEPWHFRYVGLPHSQIMHDRDFALEEYLDYLRDRKSIVATVDGERYKIAYVPVGRDGATIRVPKDASYEISGDNREGIIVTVRLTAR
ncbi:M15 family metallopeptidase [Cohnella sp. GCM10027633]|uniref:M15 family metallopeptidase n=1 Tax=unclassified Cohnella TaxID=2636738 RepID=UPI00363F41D4